MPQNTLRLDRDKIKQTKHPAICFSLEIYSGSVAGNGATLKIKRPSLQQKRRRRRRAPTRRRSRVRTSARQGCGRPLPPPGRPFSFSYPSGSKKSPPSGDGNRACTLGATVVGLASGRQNALRRTKRAISPTRSGGCGDHTALSALQFLLNEKRAQNEHDNDTGFPSVGLKTE